MSWSRRGILLGAAALAGCGFTPAYGPGKGRGRFAFVAPSSIEGFAMVARLEDRLGPPDAPLYLLTVELDIDRATSVVTADQETRRYSLVGRAKWSVTVNGDTAASGTVDSFASYSASGTTVSTEAARMDARDRLGQGLADRIVSRLLAAGL